MKKIMCCLPIILLLTGCMGFVNGMPESNDFLYETNPLYPPEVYEQQLLSMLPFMEGLNRATTHCLRETGHWCTWDEVNLSVRDVNRQLITTPGTYRVNQIFDFRLTYYYDQWAPQRYYWEAFMEMHEGRNYHVDIVSTGNGRLQIRSNRKYRQGQLLAESLFGPVQERHGDWMYWNLEYKKVD